MKPRATAAAAGGVYIKSASFKIRHARSVYGPNRLSSFRDYCADALSPSFFTFLTIPHIFTINKELDISLKTAYV